MIISASRRTDIPAFYSSWFLNRIRDGFCTVPNPFNAKQVSRVSLTPADVDAIVFWTRNPAPLMAGLDELEDRKLPSCFLFTLVNNPQSIDPHSPHLKQAVAAFRALSGKIGPRRVIWRYDPVVLSNITSFEYHLRNFAGIASQLAGYTERVIFSFVEDYRKTRTRMNRLARNGIRLTAVQELPPADLHAFVAGLVRIAEHHKMQLQSCASSFDFSGVGVRPAHCIDAELLNDLFGTHLSRARDRSQRPQCGCASSRDIGMYDSCLFGCSYCYATRSFTLARQNQQSHDPGSPSLLGHYLPASGSS